MADIDDKDNPKGKKGSVIFFFFALVVLALAVLAYLKLEKNRNERLSIETQSREAGLKAGPVVHVAAAIRGPDERRIEMVGEALPFLETTLFSKVGGYLRDIRVDYGDLVAQGELIAVIASPELDRQYDAAVADAANKEKEAKRSRGLVSEGGESEELAGQREADARIAWATVASLQAQKDYENIRAPFAGIITARYADPGALIQNASNSQGSASPVVTVSQVDRLKIQAYADQKEANSIQAGDRADIWESARPGNKVSAALSRTSIQLNARTRTLLLEFDVNNNPKVFVPGSFVTVSLILKSPAFVEIPAEALVFHGEKPFAAVLTQDNRVSLRPIVIAESNGKTVRLQSGVEEKEKVILNRGGAVIDGEIVSPLDTN